MRNMHWVCSYMVCFCVIAITVSESTQSLGQIYSLQAAESLVRRYSSIKDGTATGLTSEEFELLLESATGRSRELIQSVLGECHSEDNCTNTECVRIPDILKSFGKDDQLTAEGVVSALPLVLNTLTSENCTEEVGDETIHKRKHRRPSPGEAWAYSLGFSSIVVVISNIGACLGPIMEKRFFKRILQFLVAMGAGSLASTSLLVLVPETFDIVAYPELSGYVWKSTVAIFSIYIFFCSERILKSCLGRKKSAKSSTTKNGLDDLSLAPMNTGKGDDHGHSHLTYGDDSAVDRETLAWMVMAGDVIHNFVDGLSIGAAFTEDIALGISISLAVLCEELPHELADIAILLHSGLSIKKALLINFLSACVIYLGIILGVLTGSMVAEASKWIFAMAGGLFLYVPLVDMFPDMSGHLDKLIASGSSEARIVAALHVCGLVIGASIIIFIVNVSGYIAVE